MPSGPDVNRAKKMIGLIKQNRFERVTFLPEDDPYIFQAMLVNETKSDGFIDLPPEQQMMMVQVLEIYQRQIRLREEQQAQMMQSQLEMQAALEAQSKGN